MHSRKGVVNATAGLATIDIRTARAACHCEIWGNHLVLRVSREKTPRTSPEEIGIMRTFISFKTPSFRDGSHERILSLLERHGMFIGHPLIAAAIPANLEMQ